MKDYIMREIDKFGKFLQALMVKMRVLKRTNESDQIAGIVKAELLEKLDMDLDVLIKDENFITILINDYGFSNENLEAFAELLFEFIVPSNTNSTNAYIDAITAIYLYLDNNGGCFSIKRHYILKELEQYMR